MRRALFVPAFILFTLLVSASARAVVQTRVFVGLNGNDSNDCSKPATPCLSFAGAMAQVGAGGEIIVEASGGYGPLNITQSISINSAAGVVAFSCCTVTVNAAGATVVLRGLTIDGAGSSGHGIDVVAVDSLHVESCVITGFPSGSGLNANAAGSQLFVKDTISRQNGRGIHVLQGRASIDHCRFEGNGNGVHVNGAIVTVRDSVSAGNFGFGFAVESTGPWTSNLNVYQCLSANNASDGFVANNLGTGVVDARVANSSISENKGIGLDNILSTANFESLGNNFVRGNIGGNSSGTITTVAGQ